MVADGRSDDEINSTVNDMTEQVNTHACRSVSLSVCLSVCLCCLQCFDIIDVTQLESECCRNSRRIPTTCCKSEIRQIEIQLASFVALHY